MISGDFPNNCKALESIADNWVEHKIEQKYFPKEIKDVELLFAIQHYKEAYNYAMIMDEERLWEELARVIHKSQELAEKVFHHIKVTDKNNRMF